MLHTLKKHIITSLFSLVQITTIFITINNKPAFADCNFHGCSQSSVAECNFHGCPNAPMGKACTFNGCPASPQPQPQAQPQPIQPYPQPYAPVYGGDPQAIRQCMNGLLFRMEERRTPNSISILADKVTQVRVRTEISEDAAVRACQGAR